MLLLLLCAVCNVLRVVCWCCCRCCVSLFADGIDCCLSFGVARRVLLLFGLCAGLAADC